MPTPSQKIRSLYEEGWSVAKIAEHFGVSRQAIYERMRREKMSYRPTRLVTIPRQSLERMYSISGLTITAIAKELGHDSKTVARELDRHGIKREDRRPRKEPTGIHRLGIGERLEVETEGEPPYRVYPESKRLQIRVVVRRLSSRRFAVVRTPLLSTKAVRAMADEGKSLTQIAREFFADTKTIRKYL